MAVNETIVTGRKFRKCIDVANKIWQRISFWTKASDVEFNDGQTAENKMGAISGITSDLNGESENVAASIKVVNQLNNNLNQQPKFIYGSDGKITGYKTPGGADTVFPFYNYRTATGSGATPKSKITCGFKPKLLFWVGDPWASNYGLWFIYTENPTKLTTLSKYNIHYNSFGSSTADGTDNVSEYLELYEDGFAFVNPSLQYCGTILWVAFSELPRV